MNNFRNNSDSIFFLSCNRNQKSKNYTKSLHLYTLVFYFIKLNLIVFVHICYKPESRCNYHKMQGLFHLKWFLFSVSFLVESWALPGRHTRICWLQVSRPNHYTATVALFTSSDLNGPHRALTDFIGPHLTSSDIRLSPHRTLCHPIGMLLNRDVYDTSLSQCIRNDYRVVLSPVDAVIADVMSAGRYMKSLLIYAASAAFGITIQSYIRYLRVRRWDWVTRFST